MEGTPHGGVLVVAKAFAVLEVFREDGSDTLALRQIAERAALPKTTTHRIVTALVAEGALERTRGGYQLGLRLFELGAGVRGKRDLRDAALRFLQDL